MDPSTLDYFTVDVVGCVPVSHCVSVAFVVVVYPFAVFVVLYGSVSGRHAGGVLNDSYFVSLFFQLIVKYCTVGPAVSGSFRTFAGFVTGFVVYFHVFGDFNIVCGSDVSVAAVPVLFLVLVLFHVVGFLLPVIGSRVDFWFCN